MRNVLQLNQSLTRLMLKLSNMLWEYRLGINSRGALSGVTEGDSVPYSTNSYHEIMTVLRSLSLKPSDTFVDIGCGKGRVVCCAARLRMHEVVGVEIDKHLSDIANRNAKMLRGKKSCINIINVSAVDFDYRIGTVYYLFNPFGAHTLNQVLSKMKESLQLQPRKIKIVYVNPVAEFLLRKSNWLEIYDKWEAGDKFGLMHVVSFWRG